MRGTAKVAPADKQHAGSTGEGFTAFFVETEPRLRRALIAKWGAERGREATAEALAWAFEHWPEVQAMTNPVGYLYRVGGSRTRERKVPILVATPVATASEDGHSEELWALLRGLSDNQRLAVVLVHAYGWEMKEVAQLLDVSVSTVGTHLRRGLRRLRRQLPAQFSQVVEER